MGRLIRAKSDRLTSLPDEVLCHVLSFLPTKCSVAASILATRYRYLWRDVVNLHFDDDSEYQNSFSDAVNRVMLLRSNFRDINTFRLIIKDQCFNEEHQLDNWIRYAIARNVQALDIQLTNQVDLRFPLCLFTCQTLVDLRLHDCRCEPDAIFLPNLKKLHLHVSTNGRDATIHDIISGCPVLEELNVQQFDDYYMDRWIISSPTVKWLTVNIECDEANEVDYKLEINTPALRYLDLSDDLSQHISAGELNSLVEASISLDNVRGLDNNIYSDSVLKFVERLCQVKSLIFFSCHKQFLDSSFAAATSKFINLTKLELGADWLFLLKFLESADNLQVLIIRKFDCDRECWTEPQQVPTCLSSHLKQVTVNSFGVGSEDEFKMVSYILKHGKVLNEMKIYAKRLRTNVEKLNDLRKISEFERVSQTCKVKFS